MTPAIVVGAYTMALGVVRSLGRRGVPVIVLHYDDAAFAHRSRHVTYAERVPHPEREEAAFVDRLLVLAARWPGAAVIPASDASIAALARNHAALAPRLRLGCEDWSRTRQFIEKSRTNDLALDAGVAVARTLTAAETDDPDAVEAFIDVVGFPLLVKPSQGHLYTAAFGRKMTEVHDRRQLDATRTEAAAAGLEVMLQEIIPGPDSQGVNHNVLAVDGEVRTEFTARHLRTAPVGFGSPRAVVSEHVPEVLDPGRAIVKAIGLTGFACIEFKIDPRDNRPVLMEVNGRHNLSSMLAPACGVDFPWLHYDLLVNGRAPEPTASFREGVFWVDLVRDVATTITARRTEHLRVSEIVRPYRGPTVFAVASWRDPRPFAHRLAGMARRVRRQPISQAPPP